MIPSWIAGFPVPVVETAILFWLCAIGAGIAYGWLFEDVKEIASKADNEFSGGDSVASDREAVNE